MLDWIYKRKRTYERKRTSAQIDFYVGLVEGQIQNILVSPKDVNMKTYTGFFRDHLNELKKYFVWAPLKKIKLNKAYNKINKFVNSDHGLEKTIGVAGNS